MRRAAVGLYCAVVDRFKLLVSSRTIAARETQAVCTQRAESLHTWLGALNLGSGEGWQHEFETAPRGQWRSTYGLPSCASAFHLPCRHFCSGRKRS